MSEDNDSFFTHSGTSPPENSEQVNSTSTKVCSKCKKGKSISGFHKNASKADGLESSCKACVSERKAKKYKKRQQTKRRRKSTTVVDISSQDVQETIVNPQDCCQKSVITNIVEEILWKM